MKPSELRLLLIEYFNESELRDICFDLEIDYESLPGQGKRDKARELVAYVIRHKQMEDLIELCHHVRPNANIFEKTTVVSDEDLQLNTTEIISAPQLPNTFDEYLKRLDIHMKQSGFSLYNTNIEALSLDRVFYRRRFIPFKLGYSSTFAFIRCIDRDITPDFIKAYNRINAHFGWSNKVFLLDTAHIFYSVLITTSISEHTKNFLEEYIFKHWVTYEFPVVVDLSAKNIFYCKKSPFIGMLFFPSIKREAGKLFGLY